MSSALVAGGVPKQVEQFIRSTIVSIQQLEILLHLAAHPDRDWSGEEMAAALRTNAEAAANWLLVLEEARLVAGADGRYRYAPDRKTAAVVEELADVYRTYRTRVIALVFAEPNDAAVDFAEAFRLRRGDR